MSKVAVLRTSPETVVEDYGRLMDLAGYREALPFSAQTCLRINISWHVYMPACSTPPWLVLARVFENQAIQTPRLLMGRNVIHMPTVKTHVFTGTTGSMKNAFGGLLNLNRHWTHSVIHETLVDLLRIQKEIHPGVFAVMDGTIAGEGPGPRAMRPHD